MIEFRVLGGAELARIGGERHEPLALQPKRLALLSYLAVAQPGRFHRRDTLLALFWPDLDQAHARGALRAALHHLREALGPAALATRGDEEVAVAEGALSCDAVAFERALSAGQAVQALALYRGDLLAGLFLSGAPGFEQWLERERTRLRKRAAAAAWQLAEHEEAAGRRGEAAQWARRALAVEPYDEESLRRVIGLLDRAGEPGQALGAFEEFARDLSREFDITPAPETVELVATVRRHREAARIAPGVSSSAAPRAHADAAAPAGSGGSAGRPRQPARRWPAVAIVTGLAVAGVVAIRAAINDPNPPPSSRATIAVLPFKHLGGADGSEYFSAGITEDIVTQLAKVPGLKVISRTSSARYTDATTSAREIAGALGASVILEGSVQQSAGRVRITAQLIDAATDGHLWADTYDRELGDIFGIQSDVALRIAAALDAALSPSDTARIRREPTQDLEAYTAYLKGRYAWNQRTETTLLHAVRFFEEAIRRDPGYALAYAGLADTYIILGNFWLLPPEEAYGEARAAAERAVQLDPELGEARIALAFVHFLFDWDWAAAERGFRRGLELNSSYAPGHQWYAVYLAAMGRSDEAAAEIRLAGELDPLSLTINAVSGWIAYLARRYDEAVRHYRRTLELDPDFALAHRHVAWNLGVLGRHEEALAAARTLVRIDSSVQSLTWLAWASALAGRRGDALDLLRRLDRARAEQYVSPLGVAEVYAALGEPDQALRRLEHAYVTRDPWLVQLRVRPTLDPLRGDPRFENLITRMAFPRSR
jgi:TolB-like protein/DNA-binding SARP family transcriptional activator/Tfp pilus assembly protein PilF